MIEEDLLDDFVLIESNNEPILEIKIIVKIKNISNKIKIKIKKKNNLEIIQNENEIK
jgi:hypothetical protein